MSTVESAMATSRLPQCSMCNRDGTKLCSGCDSSRYCSTECREADWSTHKLLCGNFKDFATPPEKDMKRAILFPPESKTPKFIWVPCYWNIFGFEQVVIEDLFGEGRNHPVGQLVRINAIRMRDLKHTLEVLAGDEFLKDGSLPNKSIMEATKSLVGYDWRGPVLVAGKKGFERDPPYYDDLDMMDFRDIADYFSSYGDKTVLGKARRRSGKVKGVKIACQGDIMVLGAEKFQPLEVPRQHPISKMRPACDVPRLIGLPLLVRRYPPDPAWKDDEAISHRFMNKPATYLHLIADKDSTDWARASSSWQDSVGSVMVVRQDGKYLSSLHMEVLCAFCQYKVRPLFEQQMKVEEERDSVLKELTPEKFMEFFEAYRTRKAESSPEWRTVSFP
ncbi:MAG: hypothetical protein M1830_007754 [Pleopsidium flavum]|nr:MAG: hypothetical protein M1830_007754 [Pleopsidium flavum]